ncbi:MAG: sugar ABC transporter permease [Streptosporangiales bacterium]|nr:sugar ABC transporter permease [Streptosporangiales bacterium]
MSEEAMPVATAAVRSRRSHTPERRRLRESWPLVLPAVILSIVLVVFPILYATGLALSPRDATNVDLGKLTFDTFHAMFLDPVFWSSVGVTMLIYVGSLIPQLVLGTLIGYVMSRDVPGARVLQTFTLVPSLTAAVVVGLVWLLIYDPTLGVLNYLLGLVGVSAQDWLGDPNHVVWSLILVDIWQWTPLVALIVSAGIRNLPTEPFEAARVDGANAWQVGWRIGLPLLRPIITVVALLRTVDLIRYFDTGYIMTQGGPLNASTTMNIYAYRNAFAQLRLTFGSAAQIALFALVLVFAGVFTWLRRRSELDA